MPVEWIYLLSLADDGLRAQLIDREGPLAWVKGHAGDSGKGQVLGCELHLDLEGCFTLLLAFPLHPGVEE